MAPAYAEALAGEDRTDGPSLLASVTATNVAAEQPPRAARYWVRSSLQARSIGG